MAKNLRIWMLALFAAFAISSIGASAASALEQGELTSDGPVKLTGTDPKKSVFTYNASQKLECHGHYAIGKVGVTPHGSVTTPITTLTIAPQYTACESTVSAVKSPATVTMNGCDYVLHIGDRSTLGYAATVDIVCPEKKEIEMHLYNTAEHKTSICTFNFPPQTGLAGGYIKSWGIGPTIYGTIAGLTASRSGLLCGGGNVTESAMLDIEAQVTGVSAEGGFTEVGITSNF